MKHVFITGGTGLVGSHVIEEVLRVYPHAKITVLVYDVDPESYFVKRELAKRVRCVYGDIRDESVVRDAVYSFEIDTVFHLAAQPLVMAAYQNPMQTWQTNLMGTVHVMEAVRDNPRIERVVVASSDKAYGTAVFQPYTEDHPLHALHPYDTSKACTDMIARTYAQTYNVPVAVTRFGNIFGPGDTHYNRLIPGAMRAACTDEILEIRSDGTLTRDYVYVKDVARAYVTIAQHIQALRGEAFNVTSDVHMSVLDMVQAICRVVGKEIRTSIQDAAQHEIPHQHLSDARIKSVIGSSWATTPLDQALRETWEWYQSVT